ncbi:MAG: tetratricopeptide repeat protein [Candidatus Omnitrophota bacterium]
MKKILIILLVLILNTTAQYIASAQTAETKDNFSQDNLQALFDDYINQGIFYFEQNQLSNAKYLFLKAAQILPGKSEAYINLSAISMKRANYPTAFIILKKAENLEGDTKQNIVLYNLGLCLQKMQKYDEALIYYNKAISINPLFGDALFNRGMLYLNNEKPDMALIDIAKAEILFKNQKQKEITDKCEKIVSYLIEKNQQNKEVAEKLLKEGSESFENGKREEGIVLLNISALCDSENEETYYRLGVMYVYINKLEQAIECFNKTIELDPANTDAYINIGGAYGKLKKTKEALNVLHKALALEKKNPKIYYNIAMVYLNIGKNNDAVSYLKKAKALAVNSKDTQLREKIDETSRLLKI